MKRVLIALMLCLVSIMSFGQNFEICSDTVYIHDTVYVHDTIYITDTVFITADNDTISVGAPEDLPDDSHTEHSLVYPNPAKDEVTIINAEGANILIINQLGQIVLSLENATDNQTINVTNFANGTYFIKAGAETVPFNIVK